MGEWKHLPAVTLTGTAVTQATATSKLVRQVIVYNPGSENPTTTNAECIFWGGSTMDHTSDLACQPIVPGQSAAVYNEPGGTNKQEYFNLSTLYLQAATGSPALTAIVSYYDED